MPESQIAWGAIAVVYACGQIPTAIRMTMTKLGVDAATAISEMESRGAVIDPVARRVVMGDA